MLREKGDVVNRRENIFRRPLNRPDADRFAVGKKIVKTFPTVGAFG